MAILSYAAAGIAFIAIIALAFVPALGNRDRDREEEARDFYGEHGRWPDEPEDAAVRRPGGYGGVDDLPGRDR